MNDDCKTIKLIFSDLMNMLIKATIGKERFHKIRNETEQILLDVEFILINRIGRREKRV